MTVYYRKNVVDSGEMVELEKHELQIGWPAGGVPPHCWQIRLTEPDTTEC